MQTETSGTGAGQQIRTLLLGAAISGVLFSASIAVPLIGFVAGFLAAVPISYTRLFGGRTSAIAAALSAAVLVAIGFKPLIGVWYLAQCGIIGVVLPELLLKGKRPSSALLWSTAAATIATSAIAFVISSAAGQGIHTVAQKEITTAMEQAVRFYEQQQGIAPHDLETLKSGMKKIADTMLRIYPALATLNLLLVSAVTMVLFQRFAVRRGIALTAGQFRSFRTPEPLIWPLIISGFCMLVPNPIVTTAAMNLLTLLLLLYFCQGLAVLITLAARTSYSGMIQVLLAIMLVAQPYLIPLVAVTGIFDLWGDFRTPRIKQDENL